MTITTADAVAQLAKALKEDKQLYIAYQANIAMPFQDLFDGTEYDLLRSQHKKEYIHAISNNAAKQFLNLLISHIEHQEPGNRITQLDNIDRTTKEGRLLFAALVKLTTESQTDKEPDEVIAQLNELADKMDADKPQDQ